MANTREMRFTDGPSTKGFAPWQALAKALFDDYRPELHYMRGPGPKWHRKQHDRGVSPTVTKALLAGLRP
jgi:hypothetical protein